MAEVEVEPQPDGGFEVTVRENGSTTRHHVTDEDEMAGRLGREAAPEAFVAAAFRFLLDREPKESILPRFDVRVIPQYFPEFEDRIGDYLP